MGDRRSEASSLLQTDRAAVMRRQRTQDWMRDKLDRAQ